MKDLLNRFIYDNRLNILNNLSELVSVPSVSADSEAVLRALDLTLSMGKSMGFRAEKAAGGTVGVIEAGGGPETLGILTHVDVVPAGELSLWDTDPFEAVCKDGRVYGRGTLDDKGMIIACLYAMKAVINTGVPLRKKIRLIIGTQEETAWTDMDAYVKERSLPDYGFTPDGEYPICNIEKGAADILMEFDTGDEKEAPEGLRLISVSCGDAPNAVPGTASALLSDGRVITASGKTVHSCQPEKGDNAFFRLVSELDKLQLCENRLLTLIHDMAHAFTDIYGKAVGMYSDSEYYNGEFVHRNVFSLTVFRSEGSKCLVNINGRTAYGTSDKEIMEKFGGFALRLGGRIVRANILPAVFVKSDRPFLKALASAYEDVTGLKNEFTLAYGGSYAKAMPDIVSWGPIFPGEEDMCHRPNEYISEESLLKNAQIFAQAIFNIASSEKSFK